MQSFVFCKILQNKRGNYPFCFAFFAKFCKNLQNLALQSFGFALQSFFFCSANFANQNFNLQKSLQNKV